MIEHCIHCEQTTSGQHEVDCPIYVYTEGAFYPSPLLNKPPQNIGWKCLECETVNNPNNKVCEGSCKVKRDNTLDAYIYPNMTL